MEIVGKEKICLSRFFVRCGDGGIRRQLTSIFLSHSSKNIVWLLPGLAYRAPLTDSSATGPGSAFRISLSLAIFNDIKAIAFISFIAEIERFELSMALTPYSLSKRAH